MWKYILSSVVAIGTTAAAVTMIGGDDNIASGKIIKVIDGDTIDVKSGGKELRVRLLNIDTPEIGRDGKPSECLAEDARDYLAELLPTGTKVKLEYDVERNDKYGRELAGVFKADQLVNAEIARAGFAKAISIAPNTKFYPPVLEAEQGAASQLKGISTVGPECFTATVKDARVFANRTQESINAKKEMGRDIALLDVDRLRKRAADVDASRKALKAMRDTGATSRFYEEHFAKRFEAQLDDMISGHDKLYADLTAKETQVRDFQVEQERKRAEAEAARKAAEEAERERQQAESAAREAARQAANAAPNYQNQQVAPSPIDTYTGCRAYGGNYALTSVDKKGRPYAKIDCSTRQQIG